MTIASEVMARGISEVLHFTSNKGLLGVLDARYLRARKRLDKDARLEYIFTPNAASRKGDAAWLDYVNLSISRINTEFFGASAKNWHRYKDLSWYILSFSPEILSHSGVFFTTTNNIYPSAIRGAGAGYFSKMFADPVLGRYGVPIARPKSCPMNYTTCMQAEVLYPGELSTNHLQSIYVPDDASADEVAGQISAIGHCDVAINVDPTRFTS